MRRLLPLRSPLFFVLLIAILVVTTGCPYESNHPLEGNFIRYNQNIIGNWHHGKTELKISKIDDNFFKVYYNDHEAVEATEFSGEGYFVSANSATYIVVKNPKAGKYYVAKVGSIAKDKIVVNTLDDNFMARKTFTSATDFSSYVLGTAKMFPYESAYERDGSTTTTKPPLVNKDQNNTLPVTTVSDNSPSPDVLFKDDYSTSRNNWASNYNFKDSTYYYISTLDGPNRYYYFANRSINGYYIPVPYTLPSNYNYSFKVNVKHQDDVYDKDNNPYGIKFACSDWNNAYNFDITESGYYRVSKHQNGAYTILLPWAKTPVLRTGYQYNTIEVRVYNNYCLFYINDTYVNRLDNFVPFGKTLGFQVYDKQTIHFDDLEIRKL